MSFGHFVSVLSKLQKVLKKQCSFSLDKCKGMHLEKNDTNCFNDAELECSTHKLGRRPWSHCQQFSKINSSVCKSSGKKHQQNFQGEWRTRHRAAFCCLQKSSKHPQLHPAALCISPTQWGVRRDGAGQLKWSWAWSSCWKSWVHVLLLTPERNCVGAGMKESPAVREMFNCFFWQLWWLLVAYNKCGSSFRVHLGNRPIDFQFLCSYSSISFSHTLAQASYASNQSLLPLCAGCAGISVQM